MQVIKLSRPISVDDKGEPVYEYKNLILELNADLAIKIKRVNFDVYASLDDDNSRTWITSMIGEQDSVVQLARVIWDAETNLNNFLNSEGIDKVRDAFLEELKLFSNRHSRSMLVAIIEEATGMATDIAAKTELEARKVMKALREQAVNDVPTGEAMMEKALKAYTDLQASTHGGEPTELLHV